MDIVRSIEVDHSPFATPIRTPRPTPMQAQQDERAAQTARHVQKMLDTSMAYRKKVDAHWETAYAMYKGRHEWWRSYNRYRDNWRAKLTVNQVFTTVETIVAVLFDNKPRIDIMATSPQQHPYAQTLQIAVDQIWRRRRMGLKCEDAMRNACIYGNGYLKIFWNESLENGQGDVDVEVLPTQYLWADPQAVDVDYDSCRWIIERKPSPLSQVRSTYGSIADQVRADANQGSFAESRAEGGLQNSLYGGWAGNGGSTIRWSTPVGTTPSLDGQYDPNAPPAFDAQRRGDQWVWLVEAWFKDDRKETYFQDVLQQTPAGMQWVKVPMQREVYPFGRLVTMAGGAVLRDIPSPYRRWPYVKFTDIRLPGEFYGMGEPELLKDLQFEVNKRRSQMTDHAMHMGNAIWIIDKNSMVDPQILDNRPGRVVEKVGGTEVSRLPPPSMPSWLPMMHQTAVQEIRELSGTSSMPGGMAPRGIRSGSGFEAVHNITSTRVRTRGRNVEDAVEQAGRIIVALIQDNYTYPRMVRVLGAAGNVWFVPFDGRSVRGDWDIVVEPGSSMPQTKEVRAQRAIELYRMQAIDRRALLEATEFPDTEEVLRRLGEVSSYPNQVYVGAPGMPNPDSSDNSSYSLTTRTVPTLPLQPPGAPAVPQGGFVGGPQKQG